MSAENKALIRRWFEEVWNKGREAAIDEMLTPRAMVHGLGPDLQGPDAFKGFYRAYRNAFPDVKIQIEDILAEGDIVATRWAGAGTHQGDGLGFPATGRPGAVPGDDVCSCREREARRRLEHLRPARHAAAARRRQSARLTRRVTS